MDQLTELIGGALISALVQMLVERIASPEVLSYLLGKKDPDFDGFLSRLKMMISSLGTVLDDADERQIRNDSGVEAWLDEAQAAMFDADDLLDEIETEALRLKVGASEARESKRPKIFHFSFGSGESDDRGGDMAGRVEKLDERLEEIMKQKDNLGLRESTTEKRPWRRLPSTSLVEESEVFGRDEDKDVIIEELLNGGVNGEEIGVIPIVGMGGIGKTTLAQVVFNDRRVENHFQVKAWACVSKEFDVCSVTRTLIQSHEAEDLSSLQIKLKKKLAGKKFLIVLDDVWNEKYLDWDDVLRTPFKGGARGSKIIVTTRSEKVASIMGTVPSHQLAELSDEACWKLFAKHASGIGDFAENPELERIGREIVGKCKGLPLAVKAVGGVLRSTLDVFEWEKVSRSDLWELPDVQSHILPALKLSYNYLPSPLKRCFAYCSIFPKGYKFDKEELVLLWMAEGLLVEPNKNKRTEEAGHGYFDDLVSRSFLQPTSDKSSFVIHDLLVDLAKSVSKKFCFLSESNGSSEEISITQVRHFGYVPVPHDTDDRFSSILGATHLRTFIPLNTAVSFINLSKELVDGLLSKFRCLRALSLCGYSNIKQLPDSIGDLRHLRYLNLSHTSITFLPESTNRLYNLQTLKLALCFRLAELPKDLSHLINLRYLDANYTSLKELPQSLCLLPNLRTLKLSGCHLLTKLPKEFHRLVSLRFLELERSSLEEMPSQISDLKSLQTLSTFVVGKGIGARIGELRGIVDLRGTLHIKNLQNVVKPEEALEAKLKDKKYLEELKLEWLNGNDVSLHEKDVLNHLVPNTNLKKLEISYYKGTELSSWLGDRSFINIVDISLSNCNRCLTMPPLGQLPSLRKLQIDGFDSVVRVGPEFYGNSSSAPNPFATLEVLEFSSMPKWTEWTALGRGSEAFAKLRKLSIRNCESLTGALPSFLPSLTELTVSMCGQFVPSLPTMPNVTKIDLAECQNLSGVTKPGALDSFHCLQHLDISGDISSMQLKRLPPAMKTLDIVSNGSLQLQLQQTHYSLEELSVSCNNGSLSFALDSFPNLRKLQIIGCLDIQPVWAASVRGLQSLSCLAIFDCGGSALLPEDGPPFPSLSFVGVFNCKELKSLPEKTHILFPSLETLDVWGCSALESFPVSGLPCGLKSIHITDCDELVGSRKNWNLKTLTGLEEFSIWECGRQDIESFPDENLLPSSLSCLFIGDVKCMEELDSKWLQQLGSLKEVTVRNCANLQTMSDAALPACLESLSISGCPLIEEKCVRETGEYWKFIAHIPRIQISHQLV